MHAMSELAVRVLAASRREGDRGSLGRSRTGSTTTRSRPRGRTANLFRRRRRGCCAEWRRRRDTFLLCRRRFYDSKKRLGAASCWAFWPRLFAADVIRAVAGPDAGRYAGTWSSAGLGFEASPSTFAAILVSPPSETRLGRKRARSVKNPHVKRILRLLRRSRQPTGAMCQQRAKVRRGRQFPSLNRQTAIAQHGVRLRPH